MTQLPRSLSIRLVEKIMAYYGGSGSRAKEDGVVISATWYSKIAGVEGEFPRHTTRRFWPISGLKATLPFDLAWDFLSYHSRE